jgi:hypothetical protein
MEPVFTDRWNSVLTPLLDELERAEKAMSEWRCRNPEPQSPEQSFSEGERKAFAAEVQKLLAANGPDKATWAKHDAERAGWEKSKATAEWQTGETAARERIEAFWDEHALLVGKLDAMRATTLEGLKVKARLAQLMDEEDLAWSIVQDLAGE